MINKLFANNCKIPTSFSTASDVFILHHISYQTLFESEPFEALLIACRIFQKFNGQFWTKECSKGKVYGDLFGPKCDGEYISSLFETFEVDMGWSEMLFDAPQIFLKCHIFMLLDHHFGPKLVGNERFRTNRFGFKKFMVKAIRSQFTMSPYLPLF